jgi:predicted GIY-YIG superfamily endonuclease
VPAGTRSQATILESRVKKLPRALKLQLIAGELNIASLQDEDRTALTRGEHNNDETQ